MKPVYMINGFLESGKTEFIKYTLEQPYFQLRGKTLLILCEEGELEYEELLLKKTHTVVETVNSEEEFTPDKLLALEKKYKPERIIVEYNGMWNFKNMKLPWHWHIEQQITMIDASTFPHYFTNMRSLVAEMLRKSELIIFNRCDGVKELASFKRNVKAINPNAELIFEDANGEMNLMTDDELPFDINADIIPLKNPGYGIFYIDALDNTERYIGKKVEFVGKVLKPQSFPKDFFVPGRMAMTCCADDMAFLGFACQYDQAAKLEPKSWVRVIAEVKKEYFADYKAEGPVLYALSVEACEAPAEEVINFN